jgi:hypothetical protein
MDIDWTRAFAVAIAILLFWLVRAWIGGREQRLTDHANRLHAERQRIADLRLWIEQQMFGLMCDFPQLSDEQITQLANDALVNWRVSAPEAYRWCTPETAARVRRSAVVGRLREQV